MSGPRSGLVAVLFTDLVGSTELMSQLGDRAFDDLRRRHFAALSKAVAAHGGEEVKNTGDGLMAVFPSAAEAVEAAVAMQQATARQARNSPLAMRVGVAVGDATFEDGDYFGTPVVEAARLAAAARPGQILSTQIARALAGSRCSATFIDHGPMALKGLPEPVALCEVAWQPAGSSVPMPALLTDVGRLFVGRDGELERLNRLWKEAVAGERRVALLAGEPGVGKTRLAAELAVRAHEEGAVVLAGRCDEDLGVPYQPFVEALRHFVDHTSTADLLGGLGRYGGELARFVPELPERIPHLPPLMTSDPETERYRLFDAVGTWLESVADEAPVLLVLDDLQWAAKPTLFLLRHVVRFPKVHRVLILGTYRDTELHHDHPLVEILADLRRQEGVDRLSLLGLDSAGVALFMTEAAGHVLDDADMLLARAIHEETEGNPFFVREVLRHLTETGAIERQDGRWMARLPLEELGIPEGVREVVGRRLSHLSKETNRILRLAAVVGPEFELSVVQAAEGDLDDEELASGLEEAAAARLVLEMPRPDRYRFTHALVRDTLYQALSAPRRVTLHRRVAEAIELVHAGRLDEHLPALAHHYARASAPAAETSKAVDYARRAGDRALAQLAHDEAAAYYGQALELLDTAAGVIDESQRMELLISLGEAQCRAGDPAHRETLLQAARLAQDRNDGDALARAALANNRGIFTASERVDTELVSVLELALERHSPADSSTRARLLALLAEELVFSADNERRFRIADDALSMARRVAEPSTLAHVLVRRCTPLVSGAERHSEMLELAELARRRNDPALVFWAALLGGIASFSVGDIGRSANNLAEAAQLAGDIGQPVLRWFATFFKSAACRIAGELEAAEAFGQEAFEIGRAAGMADAFAMYAGNMFFVRYDQGRLDEMLEVFERAVSRPDPKPVALAFLGLIYCELGRLDEAQPLLDRLAADGFRSLPKHFAWTTQMAMTAEICASVGDRKHAATARSLLLPYRDLLATTGGGATGAVAHHLGLLATILERFDEADAHFTAAASRHEKIPAPTWLARTRLEWARMLLIRRQTGDADSARALLRSALSTARELGLGSVERQAVALLRAIL